MRRSKTHTRTAIGIGLRILGTGLVGHAAGCADTNQPAQKAWAQRMVTDVRAGKDLPLFHPPLPDGAPKPKLSQEMEQATAAIRESTGLEIERDVWGANGQSCLNTKLTGPKGTTPLALVLQHHGERHSKESYVTNTVLRAAVNRRCSCAGRGSSASCGLTSE